MLDKVGSRQPVESSITPAPGFRAYSCARSEGPAERIGKIASTCRRVSEALVGSVISIPPRSVIFPTAGCA